MSATKPDLLVGIDMGMCYTGISFLNRAKGSKNIKVFQDWKGNKNESRVPTRLLYSAPEPEGTPELLAWGFDCHEGLKRHKEGVLVECFKVDLENHSTTEQRQNEVRRYFSDYLRCLYENLRDYFQPSILNGKEWEMAIIEFYFSVPTTWETCTCIIFKQLVEEAGFGVQKGFTVSLDLTDPFAVAAYAICEEGDLIHDRDNVLIIDAGGGTVDLCLLAINSAAENELFISELISVKGGNNGSTYIDEGLEADARRRLERLEQQTQLTYSAKATAARMKDEFQRNKHEFGHTKHGGTNGEFFQVMIPGLESQVEDLSLQVVGTKMRFKLSDLRKLFDEQIEGINGLIDIVIRDYMASMPRGAKVNHVLLSGGLGSSRYVQEQVQAYINNSGLSPLKSVQVHASAETQLCVCKGLLYHAEKNMFHGRCARESYGIICRLPLETAKKGKKKKYGKILDLVRNSPEYISTDKNDQEGIEDYIDWFIDINDWIDTRGRVQYPYSMPVDPSAPAAAQSIELVIVTSRETERPLVYTDDLLNRGLVQTQATLSVDLSGIKPTKKFGIFKRKTSNAKFTIEAAVGIVDVSFRCLNPEEKEGSSSEAATIPTRSHPPANPKPRPTRGDPPAKPKPRPPRVVRRPSLEAVSQ